MDIQQQNPLLNEPSLPESQNQGYFQFNKKIGCGIFARAFLLSSKRNILSPQIIHTLKHNHQRLSINNYRQQWSEIFKYMEFCEAHELFIYLSNHPTIIRDISNTVFRNISQIHLSNNNINSIESLAKMDLRTLYILDLCVNHITSITPLIMCNFTSLAGLYLKRNRILSMEPLKQCHLPVLDIVRLQCYEDNVTDYDLSWATRINSNHIRQICKNNIIQVPRVNLEFAKCDTLKCSGRNMLSYSF